MSQDVPLNLDYTRHYLKWHKNTSSHRALVAKYYQDLLGPYLPKNLDALVLDVGCGMGLALSYLRSAGFKNIEGVDADAGQVKLARESGLPVFHSTDTKKFLLEKTGAAGCVLCLDVLEHIPKKEQIGFLQAVCLSLAPGGRLILTVPNANSALGMRWRYIDWTHESSFTEHSLDFVLFHAGFGKISILPAGAVRRPKLFFLPVSGTRYWWAFCFFRLFRRLEMMAELGPDQGRNVPLTLNLLAIADKDRN